MSEPVTDRAVVGDRGDGAFRVIALRTTRTVAEAIASQQVKGATARHFADLVTGTILIRLTMAPRLRVQGIVRGADPDQPGAGRGTLVADAWPDGKTRGLVQLGRGVKELVLGQGAMMQMMRSMPHGRVHQSIVEVAAEGGLNEALMVYLQSSEQITATLRVGVLFEGGEVVGAGGYIVQLLPEVTDPPLAVMAERLQSDFSDPEPLVRALEADPEQVMGEILYGMRHEKTQDEALGYGCRCSKVRVLASLATLSKEEIQELASEGEVLEIACDYCTQKYALAPKDLRGLLDAS